MRHGAWRCGHQILICQAPGKVVLWGEYAVLAGAPTAVVAVNRYARVLLEPNHSGWHFYAKGFLTPAIQTQSASFNPAPVAQIAQAVLTHWKFTEYPQTFTLGSDSSTFYEKANAKLGIGSSAAICNATYFGLAAMLDKPAKLEEAIVIHRDLQGGLGSGLDVAASWCGGAITFQNGSTETLALPSDIYWRVVWSGQSAATPASLSTFDQWRQSGDTKILSTLGELSTALCAQPFSLDLLTSYIACLRHLDQAASLNIFTPQHERLATIASAHGLLYKPCGAGGGDIGIACGPDPTALDAFQAAASRQQFVPLDLEIATHGVKISA